ncbi:MAG TPA: hypothetical protein PKM41_04575 [Deltaproteobacteria bacterium]|jgi:hypothetical protein|nr:hypothetical protein [Deltaproteobacteria bacterium]HOI05567.1 hypothetical protein [Deltaproteobacteria bacterium]
MALKGKLALFGHSSCGTTFFAEPNDEAAQRYSGACPNCNRSVALLAKELFTSIDRARREYIKKARAGEDLILWHA